MSKIRFIILLVLWILVIRNVLTVLLPGFPSLIQPNYDEDLYKRLEYLYDHSQYRQKNPTTLIPDNTLFRYAAGAYLKGVDPILINSEITPLGKYFIALSIFLFHNDSIVIVIFAGFTLVALWLLSMSIIRDQVFAVIPLVLFSSEPLFLDQIRTAPNLDIVQLPFILLALYLFIRSFKKNKFLLTSIAIGFVISTKSLVPGILLVLCFIVFLLTQRQVKSVLIFILSLPIAGLILILSYIKTFLDGYSLHAFLGFQKWIFLYQQSKLMYPFSVWRLILLNQWQTWWGDHRILQSAEWQITWPIFIFFWVCLLLLILFKKIFISKPCEILIVWSLVYFGFLSLGVISARFLLPVLPVVYVIGIYSVKKILFK